MSRGTEPAFPQPELRNGNGDVYQFAFPGLTIRELAALQIFAVAVCAPTNSTVDQDLAGAFAAADAFVAHLDKVSK